MTKSYVDSLNSPRFSGIKSFMRLPQEQENMTTLDFIVAGIPFDTGSSYATGSRFGPQSIRNASTILKPYNPVLDIDVLAHCDGADYGDIPIVPGYIEDTYRLIEENVDQFYKNNIVPVFLGGDHSITLPILRSVYKKYGPVGLVQFDAHSDTGDLFFGKKYNHGTTFRRAIEEGLIIPEKTIQIGIRGPLYSRDQFDFALQQGVNIFNNWKIRERGLEQTLADIKEILGSTPIFLTFDIDFLDAAYAPGTGTPEVCGFTTFEAQMFMLKGLAGQEIVGCDLVEVLPAHDSPGQITSFAAANIVFDMISLIAYHKASSS